MELQFDNINNIINGSIDRRLENMTEYSIMTTMLQYEPINYKSQFVAENKNYELRYFDKDFKIVSRTDKYIDIDIFPTIYSDMSIKYLFLIDVVSQIYTSRKNDNKNITIKSRYIKDNNIWKHYTTDEADKYFTFDIQYERQSPESYLIVNVKDKTNTVVESAIKEMCSIFDKDIIKHLQYINNIDVIRGGNAYIDNILMLYKLCRLKMIKNMVKDTDFEYVQQCLKNISDSVKIISNDNALELRKKIITMNDDIESNAVEIKRNKDKIKKTEEQIVVNYRSKSILIFFCISCISIMIIMLNYRNDATFLIIACIILSIIYLFLRYKLLPNESFENQMSLFDSEFINTRDMIYVNIKEICKDVVNDIAYDSIAEKHRQSNDVLEITGVKIYESRSFLTERKIYNKFLLSTLDFIYRIIIVTILVIILNKYINYNLLPAFYIVLYIMYIFDIIKIVRTNSENVYWKNQKSFDTLN